MRKINYTFLTMITIFFLLQSYSCEKDDTNPINPTNDKTTAIFNPNVTYGTMKDQVGNIYKTIHINGQTWMAENLRTNKYRNGDAIANVLDNSSWASLTKGAFCNYNNTKNVDTIATYGRLYNWYAISDSRNLAPKGWHVATNTEWKLLIGLLSQNDIASPKMKEIDEFHWYGPNEDSTNESGLTVLPSGLRDPSMGTFGMIGSKGLIWSSTQADDSYAWAVQFIRGNVDCYQGPSHMSYGFAVRCVKD